MTTQKTDNKDAPRFRWPRPFTSKRCIYEACLAFHAKHGRLPEAKDIKSLDLSYTDKKGERLRVNPGNIGSETTNYKGSYERWIQYQDPNEFEILKKTPNDTAENNTLDINDNYQDIQKAEDQHILPDEVQDTGEYLPPERRSYETNKIIRDQGLPREVKELYEYKCQICGVRLESGNFWYVEAAHIRALGEPHNGIDALKNILCLCPNHHKLFDIGGFYIEDDLAIPALNEKLYKHPNHPLDPDAIRYHREWCIEANN